MKPLSFFGWNGIPGLTANGLNSKIFALSSVMYFDALLPGRRLFTNFKPVLNTKPPASCGIKFDRNSGF